MKTPEAQEGLEQDPDLAGSLAEFVADEHLVLVRSQDDGLGEDDFTDLINNLRDRIGLEIHDVLMAAGLIDVPVAVNPEIELLATYDQTFVQGGEQQILVATETVNRNGQQPVVTAGVARDNRRVAAGTRPVR